MNRRLCLATLLSVAPVLALSAAPAQPAAKAAAPEGKAAKGPAAKGAPEASTPAAKAPSAAPKAAPLATTFAYLKAPLFAEEFATFPVATVEGEVITLGELNLAVAGAHGGHEADETAGKKDFTPILERLIDARLLVAEAREMGIDELPEYKDALAQYRETAARELLQAQVTADVKADAEEVDRSVRAATREWKVKSVLVPMEANAKAARQQLKAGKPFDEVVKQLVAEKKGTGGEASEFLPRSKMLPQVIAVLEQTKVGEVTPAVEIPDGFAIMRVDEVRYPENPKARAEAEAASLSRRRKEALQKYYEGVVKRFARTNDRLLKSLDFDAPKPGMKALLKDKRVIARIQGGKDITVADLAEGLRTGFFHGVDTALKGKKVNREKMGVFDGLLSRRVLPLEAARVGIPDSDEYARRIAVWENTMLFNRFLEKAIIPDLNVTEEQARKYYEAHRKEFSYPTMYRLESLAFTSAKQAQGAIDKLRSGTDFAWLNANAEGQVKEIERKLKIEGVVAATTLPKPLATALAGTKKGDLRLYQDEASSQYYAVHVVDVSGSGEIPFEEVRSRVNERLLGEALTAAIQGWSGKLRKVRDVQVFITRIGS